ncbi:MAG: hypothetical protein DRI26_03655 [Chloroflexi bacterium]|nr:MAG: hypothetical protein DRI26_03655 [Chloroflexota bacterium]
MCGSQVDKLCRDWLRQNYGQEIASEYPPYSLVIPAWNTSALNHALETLRQALCLALGPEESFGTADYYEARRKLELPDGRTPIPDAFIRAFVVNC